MKNKAILIGRLGADPETKRLTSGDPVVTFSLATSDTWKDKATGERKERTEWHRIVIYNENLCRIAGEYLKKGSACDIEGEIRTRKYTDREGAERYTTEIVLPRFGGSLTLLGSPRGEGRGAPDPESYGSTRTREGSSGSRSGGGGGTGGGANYQLDDDIPF